MNNVYIASDHRGAELKRIILKEVDGLIDLSPNNDPLDDYPDFAFKLCERVTETNGKGILICGSGNGMCIAANKVKGIRATRVDNKEEAFNCTQENGVNVIVLKQDISTENVKEIILSFLKGNAPHEERHIRRINKIIKYENGEYNEL